MSLLRKLGKGQMRPLTSYNYILIYSPLKIKNFIKNNVCKFIM